MPLTEEELKELEFASAEDLAAIKADPRLKKYYDATLAGVQKKFQSWSDEKKQLAQTVETLKQQATELDRSLSEWENWSTQNRPLIDRLLGEQKLQDGKGRGKQPMAGDDDRFNQFTENINKAGAEIEKKLSHTLRMLDLSMQLQDLYRAHPKMDGDKILDLAIKKGYSSLKDAYMDDEGYGKEELDLRVEERLKPRLEEELAKRTTNVESGSGSIPLTFKQPDKNISEKGWDELGQDFLNERQTEASKAGGIPPERG